MTSTLRNNVALAILATLLVSCGGKSQPGAETPAPEASAADQDEVAPARAVAAAPADKATRCDQAAEHVFELMKKELETMLEGMPAEQAAAAREEMAKEMTKEKIAQECAQDDFSAQFFDCVMVAQSMEGLQACETSHGNHSTGKTPDASATDKAPAPDASPTDAKYCDAAADHVLVIMHTYMDTLFDAMTKEQADKARAEMEAELSKDKVVAECEQKGLTKEQFACIIASQTIEDLMKCED